MSTAKAAWRCSQCGTINEAGSRACAQCGKWPSLFDLQESAVEDFEHEDSEELAPFASSPDEPAPLEPEVLEPEIFTPEPFEQSPTRPHTSEPESEIEDAEEPGSSSRSRRWASFIVPIAIAIYLVISVVFGDR